MKTEDIHNVLDIYDLVVTKHNQVKQVFNPETEYLFDVLELIEKYIFEKSYSSPLKQDAWFKNTYDELLFQYYAGEIDRQKLIFDVKKLEKQGSARSETTERGLEKGHYQTEFKNK